MQAIKGIAASLAAFTTCPCHLPLTLPLLLSLASGTAAGLWLATHQQVIWVVSVILFVGSIALTVRWLQQAQAGTHSGATTAPAEYQLVDHPTHLQNQKVEI